MQVWNRLADILHEGRSCAMVSVLDAKGSAPREAGARMVVRDDGGFHGTIGGGALEWRALQMARAQLDEGGPSGLRLRKMALGPELGQCCGGRVTLAVEIFDKADLEPVRDLAARENRGRFATSARVEEGRRVVRRVVDGGLKTPVETAALSRRGELIEQFGEDRRTVCLFGAGHVGKAMMLALAPLDFRVVWVDGRPGMFPGHVPDGMQLIGASEPETVLGQLPADAFVLVMSHSHALDQRICHGALDKGFPFVGLIGSKTKRARFESRMRFAGLAPAALDNLVCPIGVAGIGSKKPAAIAASTVAQLLIRDEALRHNGADLPAATKTKQPADA